MNTTTEHHWCAWNTVTEMIVMTGTKDAIESAVTAIHAIVPPNLLQHLYGTKTPYEVRMIVQA